MTRVIFDASMLARIGSLDVPVEVCNESGETVGYFHPASKQSGDRPVSTPFSHAEIERRRGQRTGRPLAEVLKDLPQS